TDHGAHAAIHLQAFRCALRRRAQGQALLLSRSISVHGIRATHMERELARYRSLPAGTQDEALSSRHPGDCRRNAVAHAHATRDWRIYGDVAQRLIGIAGRFYAEEPLGIELKDTVYALGSTTIDLCLSVFSWAPFRSTKAAVKLHTLLDL